MSKRKTTNTLTAILLSTLVVIVGGIAMYLISHQLIQSGGETNTEQATKIFEEKIDSFIEKEKDSEIEVAKPLFIDSIVVYDDADNQISLFEETLERVWILWKNLPEEAFSLPVRKRHEALRGKFEERDISATKYEKGEISIVVLHVLWAPQEGRERGIVKRDILFLNKKWDSLWRVNDFNVESINMLGEDNILLYQTRHKEKALSFINSTTGERSTTPYEDIYTTVNSLWTDKLYIADETRNDARKILYLATGSEENIQTDENNVLFIWDGYLILSNNGDLRLLYKWANLVLTKSDRWVSEDGWKYMFIRTGEWKKEYIKGESANEIIFIFMGKKRPYIYTLNKNINEFRGTEL